MTPPRVVVDTNVYVSRFLRPHSIPGKAVAKVWMEAQALISAPTWRELHEVLNRSKFARYVQPRMVEDFLRKVFEISEEVLIPISIRGCRDPNDDKFLELAVHGRADLIITGDDDLLTLNPFMGVVIVSPADFLGSDAEQS